MRLVAQYRGSAVEYDEFDEVMQSPRGMSEQLKTDEVG